MLTLTRSVAPMTPRSTRIVRATGRVQPVVQRVTVIDEETGEELRPLTVQDLVNGLPARVRRPLLALPAAMLRQLASLPRNAQIALLTLPADTQLAIIDGLHRLAVPELGAPPAEGAGPPGAIVPAGAGETPLAHERLPADFVDYLMGRVRLPTWLSKIRLNMARPSVAPLLEGPTPPRARLRPPDLSPESARQRRQAYGDQLATSYERPQPSAAPVVASPEVAQVAAGHRARAEARAERERDEKWSAEQAKAYGTEARQSRASAQAQQLKSARSTLAALEQKHQPTGSKKDRRKFQKPQVLLDAEQAVASLVQPPDLDVVEQQAQRERLADLADLRSANLSRDVIDALVAAVGSANLHDVLAKNGAAAIARLASRLSAVQVASILQAAEGRLPATLTDTIAAALPALFNAGATGTLIITGLKSMTNQMVVLVAQPPVACVQLLKVSNLPRLTVMCQGGQAAQLAALAPLVTTPTLVTLLDCVDTAGELATLCGPGPAPLASLLTAGVPKSSLRTWCRAPVHLTTAQLLARPDLPTLLVVLPALAGDNTGPVELMGTLTAGANAVVVCQGVAAAASVLKTPSDALQYFRAHPAHTALQFRQTTARAAATKASSAPTNPVQKAAPSGTMYTDWTHTAVIDCRTLHMLLDEGYAQIAYDDTFVTMTEKVNGGDTEEYHVSTLDANGGWVTRWVVHLHRKKGDSKKSAPIASHIKRWEHRRLKDAHRYAIDTRMADRCRLTNPN